jgi:hypothetical protein
MDVKFIKKCATRLAELHLQKIPTIKKIFWSASDNEVRLIEIMSKKEMETLADLIQENQIPFKFYDKKIFPEVKEINYQVPEIILALLTEEEFNDYLEGRSNIAWEKESLHEIVFEGV